MTGVGVAIGVDEDEGIPRISFIADVEVLRRRLDFRNFARWLRCFVSGIKIVGTCGKSVRHRSRSYDPHILLNLNFERSFRFGLLFNVNFFLLLLLL